MKYIRLYVSFSAICICPLLFSPFCKSISSYCSRFYSRNRIFSCIPSLTRPSQLFFSNYFDQGDPVTAIYIISNRWKQCYIIKVIIEFSIILDHIPLFLFSLPHALSSSQLQIARCHLVQELINQSSFQPVEIRRRIHPPRKFQDPSLVPSLFHQWKPRHSLNIKPANFDSIRAGCSACNFLSAA